MGIEFSFTGKVKAPESLIEAAQKLAEEEYYWLNIQKDGLQLALCPLSGDLYVNWSKGNGCQYEVEGSCCSTPAGPGLHQAAVEALDILGIQDLVVEDETGYYDHRDFAQMCREHFYPWLTTIVDVCWRRKDELNHMCVCWILGSICPRTSPARSSPRWAVSRWNG